MAYVHPYSKRCEKSEVDLFSIPPTQLSLEKGRWIEYRPLSSVQNNDSAITFVIAGTDEYLDLSKTILVVEGKVVPGTGGDLSTGQASIAPVNNFLHSLFRQVDVYFNGKQVTPAMGTYAYRSYLETLLNYDVSAKQSQLSSAMYYKDTAGKMDEAGSLPGSTNITFVKSDYDPGYNAAKNQGNTDVPQSSKIWNPGDNDKETVSIPVPGTGNQGFAKRHTFIENSKKFTLSGPIFTDVFMSDRLLINMLDLKVVLNRSYNEFCLMDKNSTSKNPRVELTDVVLKIRKVKVDQAIRDSTEILLKQTPAIYPVRRVVCKALSIAPGLPNVRLDNIFSGLVPTSFVFGLVDSNAYTGEYGKNPFNFKHYDISTITLSVNGEEIPFKQLRLKFPNPSDTESKKKTVDFIQAYNTLFSGTGKMFSNMGLDITRDDYPQGFTLFAFDLTPDMCNTADYFNTVQRGTLSVDLTFEKDTPEAISMVCYSDFENIIRIDSERNVIYDIS